MKSSTRKMTLSMKTTMMKKTWRMEIILSGQYPQAQLQPLPPQRCYPLLTLVPLAPWDTPAAMQHNEGPSRLEGYMTFTVSQ